MIRTPPSVNLVVRDNGLGLSRDAALLTEALKANGCSVHITPLGEQDEQQRWRHGRGRRVWFSHWRHRWARWRGHAPYDLNIMFEHLWPLHLPLARCNIALPNPEWFDSKDAAHLRRIDQVWAKTRHAEQLFRSMGCTTSYVGFDSDDCYAPQLPRERTFFHLAGGSRIKGTERLLALWRKHPEWPLLTVVQNPACAQPGAPQANIRHCVEYLSQDALQALQNSNAFHICPSEAEGWGHYIVEAMGVGAVVIATDTAPMNEMITPERGLLVPGTRSGTMGHAATYHFDETAMEQAIAQAMAMSDAQIQQLGEHARAWFLRNREEFPQRIGRALAELSR
ncbi:glycosyltransferase family 4 protein [Dyella acidiphila]|uniref:Glycosyltransferase family 4 protein n=1 Tax=Dyella acidiphila TaxID=2775866 RepID=A0ABR9GE44_9GAMM|nr:glycosyltransferase family 4 protein [Dyella acidiphila]MBE1162315.1 glycosyltransferase family 4 protein [Dyella acidiphila]